MLVTEIGQECIFPSDLFSNESQFDSCGERVWWGIHTRPRAEKRLAQFLAMHDVPFFLPWYSKNKQYQRRNVETLLPLFPSYLFLFGTEEERLTALKSNRIVSVLPIESRAEQQNLWHELSDIYELLQTGEPVLPEMHLEPGQKVFISDGPFMGREGTLIRRSGKLRLLISVDFLQQGASVEVGPDVIEVV